jgi:hypothetical protein
MAVCLTQASLGFTKGVFTKQQCLPQNVPVAGWGQETLDKNGRSPASCALNSRPREEQSLLQNVPMRGQQQSQGTAVRVPYWSGCYICLPVL